MGNFLEILLLFSPKSFFTDLFFSIKFLYFFSPRIFIKFLEIVNFVNLKSLDKFDIVFLDPPYKNNDFYNFLEILDKKKILNKRHVVLLHRDKNSKKDDVKKFNVVENKIYGRSEIFFLKLF